MAFGGVPAMCPAGKMASNNRGGWGGLGICIKLWDFDINSWDYIGY
jgi:hypothetical protein